MKRAISLAFAMVLVLAFFAAAGAEVKTKFYGYQWVNYTYYVEGAAYAESTKSYNTFAIPRTYLRYKMSDSEMGIDGHITLDIMNYNSAQASNVTSTGKQLDWAIWVKKGYVDLKKLPGLKEIGMTLRVGQQDTYFGQIDRWAYPVIEKAIEDKNSIVSSADLGVGLVGLLPEAMGSYELAIYNGTGYKQTAYDATNNYTDKAYCASVLFTPIAGIYARASYYKKLKSRINASPTKHYDATALVLGGASGPIEGFIEYFVKNETGKYPSVGWSGFLGLGITKELSLNARYDSYSENTMDESKDKNLYVVGVGYKLSNKTSVQVNYQLDAQDAHKNKNKWMAQFQWGW